MRPRASQSTSEPAVLDALLAAPPEGLTRTQLQEDTGLSSATLVTLLKKPDPRTSSAGRLLAVVEEVEDDSRLTRYRLKPDAAYCLGLALCNDHVRVAIGDAQGNILRHPNGTGPWEHVAQVAVDDDPWAALDDAADLVAHLVSEFETETPTDRSRIIGIGVSVTNSIEPDTGMFRSGWAPDAWEGLRVANELRERLAPRALTFPLVIEKDSNLAALACTRSPWGRDLKDFVFVNWAQHVGAGLILGGKLQRGISGSAGALGHMPVADRGGTNGAQWHPDDNHRCDRCDTPDCLDAMIGVDRLRMVHAEKSGRPIGDTAQWATLAEIQRAALQDRESLEAEILLLAAVQLGGALGVVVSLLNPQLVVIGGAMSREHGDLLSSEIRRGMRRAATAPAYRDVDVQFTDLGIMEGAIASVLNGRRLASLLTPRQR